ALPNRSAGTADDIAHGFWHEGERPRAVHLRGLLVTPMWTEEDRRQLAELCRLDDRLRAEHAAWMARREAQGQALTRKSDDQGALGDRTTEKVLAEPRGTDAEPFYADASPSDVLATALDEFSKATVDKVCALEIANAELRGKVDALLTLLGQKLANMPTGIKP